MYDFVFSLSSLSQDDRPQLTLWMELDAPVNLAVYVNFPYVAVVARHFSQLVWLNQFMSATI